jgi:hypothetical protein
MAAIDATANQPLFRLDERQNVDMEPDEILLASDEQLSEMFDNLDSEARLDRVRRLREVNGIFLGGAGAGFWHTGGAEATWILEEAKDSYIYGFSIASLFASHAACERRLAGIVASLPDDRVPEGWERWGLGRLTDWAVEQGWLAPQFGARVRWVSERRKSLGHYRRPVARDTLIYRLLMGTVASGMAMDVADALDADALDALQTTYDLYTALSGIV